MSETKKKKSNLGTIIKWIIIVIGFVILFVFKKEDMLAGISEIKGIPWYITCLCLLSILCYFVLEGFIIMKMTTLGENKISLFTGFKCALYCAFFKLATLGTASGVAEIYYLNKNGVTVGEASGIGVVQYTFQKISITFLGVLGFILAYLSGIKTMSKYSTFLLTGTIIALGIVIALYLISTLKRFAELLCKIINKVLKKFPEKAKSIEEQIMGFNSAGKEFWSNPLFALKILSINVIKMLFWYVIPPLVFISTEVINIPLYTLIMATVNMLAGVMVAPVGAGTLEYTFTLIFSPLVKDSLCTAAIILYRFFTMVIPCLVGAFFVILDRKTRD